MAEAFKRFFEEYGEKSLSKDRSGCLYKWHPKVKLKLQCTLSTSSWRREIVHVADEMTCMYFLI